MTRNFKLISEQFAALWAQQVRQDEVQSEEAARELRQASPGAHLSAAGRTSPSTDPAHLVPPRVLTKHSRRIADPDASTPAADAMELGGSSDLPRPPRVFRAVAPVISALAEPASQADQAGPSPTDDADAPLRVERATRHRRPLQASRAPSVPVIIHPLPSQSEGAADSSTATAPPEALSAQSREALLDRLKGLEAAQLLAWLLLSEEPQREALASDELWRLFDYALKVCHHSARHTPQPMAFWDVALAGGPGAAPVWYRSLNDASVSRVSLLALLIAADDPGNLIWIDPHAIDLFSVAAELTFDHDATPQALTACAFAIHIGAESFVHWLLQQMHELRGQSQQQERLLTRLLREAIDSWSAAGSPLTDTQLEMLTALLQLGALLDRPQLEMLAPDRPAGDLRATWNWLASRIHEHDAEGLAALQLLISAARYGYDLSPREGGPNAMSNYVAGNHPMAVEMFLQCGFPPQMPDHSGLSPRGHGARAGALDALAIMDLHAAGQRLRKLRDSASEIRELERLFT